MIIWLWMSVAKCCRRLLKNLVLDSSFLVSLSKNMSGLIFWPGCRLQVNWDLSPILLFWAKCIYIFRSYFNKLNFYGTVNYSFNTTVTYTHPTDIICTVLPLERCEALFHPGMGVSGSNKPFHLLCAPIFL